MKELLINNEIDFMKLAISLGEPIPSRVNGQIIDILTPLKRVDAHSQSLSANFGTGSFPFHSDGAYLKVPPKYIILRYVSGISSLTPTIICDLKGLSFIERQSLKHSIWKVNSRMSSFYSSILSENDHFYRFDKCVMKPINAQNDNSSKFEDIVAKLPKQIVNWEPNKVVIIDNWTSLHNRPAIHEAKLKIENFKE